ncbi:MAG: DUF4367 domain-containing protein [Clostridia bacterium]|nr:DUF4367 domain-containing protein [Clostridia bacterium]
MLDESKLYDAFSQYTQFVASRLPKEEDLQEISFSPRFEERMERLLQRQKRFYYPLINTMLKRVACIASAVLVSGSAVALSVYSNQKEESYFNVRNFSENGVYVHFFNIDLPYETTKDPITPKVPSYLPEGYFLKEDRSEPRKVELIYEGEGTDCFYYAQYGNSSDAQAYAEDALCERIRVGEYEGYLLKSESCTHLIFNDGEYLYQLNGTLTEEEMFKVAESIQ